MTGLQEDIFKLALKGNTALKILEWCKARGVEQVTFSDVIDAIELGIKKYYEKNVDFVQALHMTCLQFDMILEALAELEAKEGVNTKTKLAILSEKAKVLNLKAQTLQSIKKSDAFFEKITDIVVRFN